MELYHYNPNHDELGKFASSNKSVNQTLSMRQLKRRMYLADLTASNTIPGYDFVKDILKESTKETMNILKDDFKNYQKGGNSFIKDAFAEAVERKGKKTIDEPKTNGKFTLPDRKLKSEEKNKEQTRVVRPEREYDDLVRYHKTGRYEIVPPKVGSTERPADAKYRSATIDDLSKAQVIQEEKKKKKTKKFRFRKR